MSNKKNLEKELAVIGIKSEAQLNEAIKKLSPLNLYIMTVQRQERKAS